MKKYKNAKEWVNSKEVESVFTNFVKSIGMEKINLTADTLSTEIINRWAEWIEKEDNRKDAKAVLYDFVKDTIEDEETPYPEDVYEKWMLYRAGGLLAIDKQTRKIKLKDISEKFVEIRRYFGEGKHDQEKEIIMKLHDPDGEKIGPKLFVGSKLLQDIYKTLWAKLSEQEFMKHSDDKGAWICSDTMTSAQQKMNGFLQVIEKEDVHCNIFQTIKKEIGPSQRYSQKLCIELYFRGCLNPENENFYGKTFKEKICDIAGIEAEGQLYRFLECWHMLGNYCPVPRHFNSARSGPGRSASHDYWDLTLIKIKAYYDKKRVNEHDAWKELKELLHGCDNALSCKECCDNASSCKKWLDYFETWEGFIEQNYMQDFVEGNYDVKRFFKDHDWNKLAPETLEEFKDLFRNASEMIEKRTMRIIIALSAGETNGKTKTNQSRKI